jgi:hypothetical protein
MYKDEYGKEKFVGWFKDLLGERPAPDALRRIARLSFDANGLKAVNDLSASHEKGTEYLRRIAEAIYDEEGPARKRLEELGVTEVLPMTGGGDEYSIVVRGKHELSAEALDEVVAMYERAIEAIDVSDLVDFTDEDVRLRYLGVPRDLFDRMPEEKREEVRERMRKEIPEGFKMRASTSGGQASAYAGFLMAMRHKTKPLAEGDDYGTAINKTMGGLWDGSDLAAKNTKEFYKAGLRAGESPEDRFYSKVLARTEEARILESELEEKDRKIRRQEAFMKETAMLAGLLASGQIDAARFSELLEEKRRELLGTDEAE